MEAEGVAWISVHHNAVAPDYLTAMVELGCLPAGRNALVERLMRDGRVVSIDESSRGSDLVLTVVVTDLDALSRYVLDDLEPMAEITSVRSSVVLNAFGTGADWRAGTLDADQLAELRRLRGNNGTDISEPASPSDHLPPESWEIAEQLVATAASRWPNWPVPSTATRPRSGVTSRHCWPPGASRSGATSCTTWSATR